MTNYRYRPDSQHPNACPECGTWRTDGQRPTVHAYRCSRGPDGSQVGVIRTSTYHLSAMPAPSRSETPDQWRSQQRDRDHERRRTRRPS